MGRRSCRLDSFEQLDRFARATGEPDLPTWKWFDDAVRASGDVGIWHETYKVRAGEYECIYIDMPPVGLGGRRPRADRLHRSISRRTHRRHRH